jgi:hypothetical protein
LYKQYYYSSVQIYFPDMYCFSPNPLLNTPPFMELQQYKSKENSQISYLQNNKMPVKRTQKSIDAVTQLRYNFIAH